jgi:hypothetical protein
MTPSGLIQPHQSKNYADAYATFSVCKDLILRWGPDWRLIAEHLKPFEHIDGFPEVAPNVSATMMSMLLATLGDCYRELGLVKQAASVYQRSLSYRPSGCHLYYADMVLNHGLSDHYRSALEGLRSSEENRRGVPIWKRVLAYITSLWMCWRCGKPWYPMWGKEKNLHPYSDRENRLGLD